MATKDEVVDAITHIMNATHTDQWRGKLNNFDYQQLKAIYDDSTPGNTFVKDTLLGALRNQYPTLFDPKTGAIVNPPAGTAAPAPTSPAGSTTTPETTPDNTGQPTNTPATPGKPEQTNHAAGQPSSPDGTDELSGKAAEAAKKLDTALTKNRSDLNAADVQLSDAILSASTSDEAGKTQLNGLKQSIIDEVNRIGPDTINTRAGMQEFATFLQDKTSDIMKVVSNAKLDSDSQSKIMDALTARFNALGQHNGQSPSDPANPSAPAPGAPPGSPADPATPGTPGSPGDPGLGPDPLLGAGLPSDPFMQGLGGALGPALGAMGSLPQALGSAIPGLGGGGGGLSDLGPAIGSALKEAGANDKPEDDKPGELKDHLGGKPDEKNPELRDHPETKPGEPGPQQGQNGQPGAPGQPVPPPAGATPVAAPDLTVKVEGLGTLKADNPALAMASREVLAGGNVHDAYNRFNIALPPPGTPVTDNAVSPGKTVFGDIGQYTDHQIMALGDNKAWVNGQVVPLDKVEQGTNFLGWLHPHMPAPAAPVGVTAAAPVMTSAAVPQVTAAVTPAVAPLSAPVPTGSGLQDAFPGLNRQ